MAEKILDTNIPYETGTYLYFCKKERNGNLGVYKAMMQRGRKPARRK